MKSNVSINDFNAYLRSSGFPKTDDVHGVGNLALQVTRHIVEILAQCKKSTKPLPRVLLIGDSITGTYKGHAGSYLKIGEAMGKAMLELTGNTSK